MKTNIYTRLPALILAAGLSCTTLQSTSFASGWFLPLQYPAGEYHKYWAIGLSTPELEQGMKMHTLKDGTHIFAIKAENGAGHVYLWDRISDQYNCPVLASTDPGFKNYTTMNRENFTFLTNVYYQLRGLWGNGGTKEQAALLSKLQGAIAKNGDRIF
jgi:hypothetical protein